MLCELSCIRIVGMVRLALAAGLIEDESSYCRPLAALIRSIAQMDGTRRVKILFPVWLFGGRYVVNEVIRRAEAVGGNIAVLPVMYDNFFAQ